MLKIRFRCNFVFGHGIFLRRDPPFVLNTLEYEQIGAQLTECVPNFIRQTCLLNYVPYVSICATPGCIEAFPTGAARTLVTHWLSASFAHRTEATKQLQGRIPIILRVKALEMKISANWIEVTQKIEKWLSEDRCFVKDRQISLS